MSKMTVEQAREKFPVGSKVEVVNSGESFPCYEEYVTHHSPENASLFGGNGLYDGDMAEILFVGEHDVWPEIYTAIAIIKSGERVFVIGCEGIKPIESGKSDEPKFELQGEKLILTNGVYNVARDLSFLMDELRIDLKDMMDTVKEGDIVKIVAPSHCYTVYADWMEKNLSFREALHVAWDKTPKADALGRVIKVAEHETDNDMLYAVAIENSIYVMGERGIKKYYVKDPAEINPDDFKLW